MSDLTIRLAIQANLQQVPGIGMVHEYSRWIIDPSKFLAQFQEPASKKILGWEITRLTRPGKYLNAREEEVVANYAIYGYMGLQDADRTDIKFNALIDLVADQIRQDITLGGINQNPQGFNVNVIDIRQFGTVLCHHCEIIIPIQYVTP